MSTQNNRGRSTREPASANPPTTTPDNYSTHDHSFTLQLIMELQRSVGQLAESVNQTHRQLERFEDKADRRFDGIESAMSGVKITIAAAGVVLAIVIAISGFFVDKAWDSVASHIDISVKK